MLRRGSLICTLGLAWVAGCAAAGPGPGGSPAAPPAGVAPGTRATLEQVGAAARADAARRSGVAADALQLVSAERVTWRDGGLGCPQPGMAYTMALVPGFRVVLKAGSESFDYHADQRGNLLLCPAGRATDPLGDTAR